MTLTFKKQPFSLFLTQIYVVVDASASPEFPNHKTAGKPRVIPARRSGMESAISPDSRILTLTILLETGLTTPATVHRSPKGSNGVRGLDYVLVKLSVLSVL